MRAVPFLLPFSLLALPSAYAWAQGNPSLPTARTSPRVVPNPLPMSSEPAIEGFFTEMQLRSWGLQQATAFESTGGVQGRFAAGWRLLDWGTSLRLWATAGYKTEPSSLPLTGTDPNQTLTYAINPRLASTAGLSAHVQASLVDISLGGGFHIMGTDRVWRQETNWGGGVLSLSSDTPIGLRWRVGGGGSLHGLVKDSYPYETKPKLNADPDQPTSLAQHYVLNVSGGAGAFVSLEQQLPGHLELSLAGAYKTVLLSGNPVVSLATGNTKESRKVQFPSASLGLDWAPMAGLNLKLFADYGGTPVADVVDLGRNTWLASTTGYGLTLLLR